MESKRFLILPAILSLLSTAGAVASPATPDDARLAAKNWLRFDAKPTGAELRGQVREVRAFRDDSHQSLYHKV